MSSASPRLMCIACEQIEVTLLEVVCPNCRSVLDAGGDLGDVGARPPNTERVQIGPLDVSSYLPDQVAAATTGRLIFPRPASAGRGFSIRPR
jgi:hypothetical protein